MTRAELAAMAARWDEADPGWRERARAEASERNDADVGEITAAYDLEVAERARRRAGTETVDAERADCPRADRLVAAIEAGACSGAWMFGPVGTGKTWTATVALTRWMAKDRSRTGAILPDSALYSQLMATFQGGGATYDGVLDRYRGLGMLVIDDLGKAPAKDWFASALYDLADWRWSHRLPTLVTSQMQPTRWVSEAARQCGGVETPNAVVSRLLSGAERMRFDGPDRRQANG